MSGAISRTCRCTWSVQVHPKSRALRSRAPSGVYFRGHLASADLAAAYRGASVAVFAPYGEEFGMAPLEAMASSVPVVAWRDGGLQETVLDGQTGYLVSD